MIISAETNC